MRILDGLGHFPLPQNGDVEGRNDPDMSSSSPSFFGQQCCQNGHHSNIKEIGDRSSSPNFKVTKSNNVGSPGPRNMGGKLSDRKRETKPLFAEFVLPAFRNFHFGGARPPFVPAVWPFYPCVITRRKTVTLQKHFCGSQRHISSRARPFSCKGLLCKDRERESAEGTRRYE